MTRGTEDAPERAGEVPRFGIVEVAFELAGDAPANPYWDMAPRAALTGPGGRTVTVDLFWDGGRTWRFRYAPGRLGSWTWRLTSGSEGLDGKQGSFRCVASDRKGGIMPMEGYPYHFAYEDGTPFWLFGDTHICLFGSLPELGYTPAAFEQYVARRASQGFNFVWGIVTSPRSGNEGGPPFLDDEQRHPNPAFFQAMDRRVACLNANGITPMIFLSWGGYQAIRVLTWNAFADQEACNRYARYVASRYGAGNVCFGLGGEMPRDTHDPDTRRGMAVGEHLCEHNPQGRMICIHSHAHEHSSRHHNDRAWMSFGDFQQNYRDLHGEILRSRFADPAARTPWPAHRRKPVVNGEYALFRRDWDGDGKFDKPNGGTLRAIRQASWDIVMGGGYFVTGWGSTYWGGWSNPRGPLSGSFEEQVATRDYPRQGGFRLDDPEDVPWEAQAQHIPALFHSLPWWTLEPSDHLVGGDGDAPWCLADPGRHYVVYTRTADHVTVHLAATPGAYRLEHFDTATGHRTPIGPVSPGVQRIDLTCLPDWQEDCVLVLTADSELDAEAGATPWVRPVTGPEPETPAPERIVPDLASPTTAGEGGLPPSTSPPRTLAEAVAWLEMEAERLIRLAERPMADGVHAFPPRGYNAFWLRDYAYMLEGAVGVFTEKELHDAVRVFVEGIGADGAAVDCVTFDGTPIYRPGYGSMGKLPVADGPPFTVDVVYRSWQRLQDDRLLEHALDDLIATMDQLPRDRETGLVHIAEPGERCPYGFTDTVPKSGDVLFTSLLFIQACRQLAEMLDNTRPDVAHIWRKRAEEMTSSARTILWDEKIGLFRASTGKCNMPDIWGSAFAVFLDVTSEAQALRIAHYFQEHYAELVRYGHVRHLPGYLDWEGHRTEHNGGEYQHGAWWPTPLGWFVYALDRVDHELADRPVLEMVTFAQRHGVCEWINGETYRHPGYAPNAALPLAGIRAMIRRREDSEDRSAAPRCSGGGSGR